MTEARDAAPQPPITVFWRPGCGFCSALLMRLEDTDLVYRTVNIWEDDAGRAFVRSVANGNETVPTVVVGERALVNPSLAAVQATVDGSLPGFTSRRRRRA